MKKKQKRFMSILLIIAMLVSVMFPASDSRAGSHQNKKGLYEGDGFQVQFDVMESWEHQYNASVTIKNVSGVTIDDWFLKFPFSQKITKIWNGALEKEKSGYMYIKNSGHNQDISSGESITFGMTVEGDFTAFTGALKRVG